MAQEERQLHQCKVCRHAQLGMSSPTRWNPKWLVGSSHVWIPSDQSLWLQVAILAMRQAESQTDGSDTHPNWKRLYNTGDISLLSLVGRTEKKIKR